MRILIGFMLLAMLAACTPEPAQWELVKTIPLGNATPIGIVKQGDDFWISDGDHNRVVLVDSMGREMEAFEEMERPMHIDMNEGILYIPEYGSDTIRMIQGGEMSSVAVHDSLDAPGGVDVRGIEMAIADFYSHRVFYYDGDKRIVLGGEGQEDGMFYYPTDIQLTDDKIWVADAYNNRVQTFDKQGNFLSTYGELDDINAATGIFVEGGVLYVTDFENSRILVFSEDGLLLQEITEQILKPTDIYVSGGMLYVSNYKGKSITVYGK